MKKRLPPNQLSLVFQGHMGLIAGPELTLGHGAPTEMSVAIAEAFGVSPCMNYLDTCEAALTLGNGVDAVQAALTEFIAGRPPAPLSARLAKINWGGILSFTPDTALDDLLRSNSSKNAFRSSPFQFDHPHTPIPPRCVPVIKPLGIAGRESLLVSKYEYSRQRPQWRNSIRRFLDLVKDAPVLCLGMSDFPWALSDILAELGSFSVYIKELVVLENDPLVQSGDIDRMVDPRTTLVVSSGSPGDLAHAAEAGLVTSKSVVPRELRPVRADDLTQFSDIAVQVDPSPESYIKAEERQQLFEMLFAPTSAHWDPFAHALDFSRTATADLATTLNEALAEQAYGDVVVMRGAAATGKTVILKRVAFDLASKGHLVLWLRPYFYPDTTTRISQLFKNLARVAKKGVCIIQDDPCGLGSLSLKELGAAARSTDVPAKFLISIRSSDWSTREPADLLGPLKLLDTVELPDTLDDDEWNSLPDYLTRLGIARTREDALKKVKETHSRRARDTLSMMYWLLPETRAHIHESITQEYFRLGDHAGFRKVVLGQAEHSSDLLKRAYEMVAVADKYRAAIPIEVLVSALDIDYHSWLDATSPTAGAWGLVYTEDNPDAQTFSYRTRNDVVTSVLITQLNRGSFSRSGEVRVLRSILDACTGTLPSYREFCERILCGNEYLETLEYADGLDLYERALNALPYSNKTLVHHKGIWIRKKGRRPLEALKVFEQALTTDPTPYSRRSEADEHIYTSAAAAMIDAIKDGSVGVEAGKQQALGLLARSRSTSFFNASAVHVHANLALELANRIGFETADSKHLTAAALADVDRTVLILEGNPSRESGEDVSMLRQVRQRVIENAVDISHAKSRANEMWLENQNQDGFCLAARSLLNEARVTGKGKSFKAVFDYCCECFTLVSNSTVVPAAALSDVRLQTLYEWRIHAWRKRPKGGFIDWETFYADIVRVLPSAGSSPLYRYFEGLACAHRGKWNEAAGAFTQIRQTRVPTDLLWSRRDVLLDREGNPRELQGTVRQANQRKFLHVEELGSDFLADRDARWPQAREITTCYVMFAFGGPTAVPRCP